MSDYTIGDQLRQPFVNFGNGVKDAGKSVADGTKKLVVDKPKAAAKSTADGIVNFGKSIGHGAEKAGKTLVNAITFGAVF
jgi:hypothetical protein